jgi:hypothetical protein
MCFGVVTLIFHGNAQDELTAFKYATEKCTANGGADCARLLASTNAGANRNQGARTANTQPNSSGVARVGSASVKPDGASAAAQASALGLKVRKVVFRELTCVIFIFKSMYCPHSLLGYRLLSTSLSHHVNLYTCHDQLI